VLKIGRKKQINEQLTQAAHRLLVDRKFAEAFRKDPAVALSSSKLDEAEVEALKSGDELELARLGADVRAIHKATEGRRPPFARALRIIGRVAPGLAGAALALGMWAAPAHAERTRPGRRALIRLQGRVGRVQRRAFRRARRARGFVGGRRARLDRNIRTVRARLFRILTGPAPKPSEPSGQNLPFKVG
jgi:hypothetical protein